MPIDMEKINLFVLAVASVLIAGCRDDDYLYVRDDGIFTQSVLYFGSGGGEVTVQAETGFSGFSVSYSSSYSREELFRYGWVTVTASDYEDGYYRSLTVKVEPNDISYKRSCSIDVYRGANYDWIGIDQQAQEMGIMTVESSIHERE